MTTNFKELIINIIKRFSQSSIRIWTIAYNSDVPNNFLLTTTSQIFWTDILHPVPPLNQKDTCNIDKYQSQLLPHYFAARQRFAHLVPKNFCLLPGETLTIEVIDGGDASRLQQHHSQASPKLIHFLIWMWTYIT